MSNLTDEAANEILQNSEWCKFSDAREMIQEVYVMGYTHAAAVSAEKDAEIARLRNELDIASNDVLACGKTLIAADARIKVLEDALQFIAGHDLDGADDRARAIICGLFIIKAKKALADRAALGDKRPNARGKPQP